jgi:hypothetical protein
LKEEALDRTIWRNRFGRVVGPLVRQNTEWMNDPENWTNYSPCISFIHCLCLINFNTLDVGIFASVCGLANSPS